ncbi:MAG TPA: hypothetical protein VMT23_01150 [Candidatus Binatia bacterium]|nr:hypothetical protein [Candidatus Binatia bacterium]
MALFNRSTSKTEYKQTVSTADGTQIYHIESSDQTPAPTSKSWPMLVALIVAALAFAVLIVLGGRWAYDHWHKVPAAASSKDLPPPPPSDLTPGQ